jgi:plastocyanin
MVFAINCGPDGAENSFTNFKNAALAIGASAGAAAPTQDGSYGGGYGAPPAATPSPDAAAPSESATPSESAGAAGATHTVVVGGSGKLSFEPSSLKAQPGDVVTFQLYVYLLVSAVYLFLHVS